MMDWDGQLQGSERQKKFRLKQLTGGKITPREFGGTLTFDSRNSFLRQQTHGLASGFNVDEKRLLRNGVTGGNIYSILHYSYANEILNEQEKALLKTQTTFGQRHKSVSQPLNKAQQMRRDFNLRQLAQGGPTNNVLGLFSRNEYETPTPSLRKFSEILSKN